MKLIDQILLIMLLICTAESLAGTLNSDHHHSRVGFHGMVLVTDGSDLFASHLPLYRSPHDFQLVYKVSSRFNKQLIARLTAESDGGSFTNNMVTLLPAKFDLNKLVDGDSFEIATQFYTGHFERGGKKWLEDQNFKFVRQIYKRPLANLTASQKSESMVWDVLENESDSHQLWIHQIQTRPSMDAIVLGTNCAGSPKYFEQRSLRELTYVALKKEFKPCKNNRILYFETQDFAL